MKERVCGAIVNYNPCTVYGRMGNPCPHYDKGRKCGIPKGECDDPYYDGWYKNVSLGRQNAFYPNRMKLFERLNGPLFVYHSDKHGITGEAQVTNHTIEKKDHYYWFTKFTPYQTQVQLELLVTDRRLLKMAKTRRWKCVYMTRETIKEIRHLSNISMSKRKNLSRELEEQIYQLDALPVHVSKRSSEYIIKNEISKLEKKVPDNILNNATEYVKCAKEHEKLSGFSTKALFYTSIYLAYRMEENPRIIDDFSEISGINKKQVNKCYRYLVRYLRLKVPRVKSERLVTYYGKKTGYKEDVIKRGVLIARKLQEKKNMLGRAPSSIAAVSVYAALNENFRDNKLAEISKSFRVSTHTIQNLFKRNYEVRN